MKHVVITGSSSGIGLGLAREFIKVGFSVTVSGRNEDKLKKASAALINDFPEDQVHFMKCDVRSCSDLENLWNSAIDKYGKVDIWINNAGIGQDYIFISEFEEEAVNNLVDINIKGVINASRIVFNKMDKQGIGAVYNMEGFGSDGRKMAKLSIYGTTKSAVSYFTKSFVKETKGSNVIIGLISPGMVITELFLKPKYKDEKEANQFLKIANILADKVETVTPWLVKKIINNTKHGRSFNWLSSQKVMRRFLHSVIKKRNIINKSDINI